MADWQIMADTNGTRRLQEAELSSEDPFSLGSFRENETIKIQEQTEREIEEVLKTIESLTLY